MDHDEIAIRLGSALYSKQQKRYHELEHVKGYPLIFAIESFHDEGSLFNADTPLLRYLYGLKLVRRLAPGLALPAPGVIGEHRTSSKVIPSGWFYHAGNEYVSAVLFSNGGQFPSSIASAFSADTAIPGSRNDAIWSRVRLSPGAMRPVPFTEDVAEKTETWAEGLVLIHHPVATLPVEPSWFPKVTQVFAAGKVLRLLRAPRHIFSQFTSIVQTRACEP